jgi:hypothetical protein
MTEAVVKPEAKSVTAKEATKKVAKKAKFTGKKKQVKAVQAKAKGTKKATVKQGKGSTARRPRLDPKAKVVRVAGVKNDKYKVDGPRFKRLELVLQNSGKTVEQIRALKGLKSTTLRTALNLGLVKIA